MSVPSLDVAVCHTSWRWLWRTRCGRSSVLFEATVWARQLCIRHTWINNSREPVLIMCVSDTRMGVVLEEGGWELVSGGKASWWPRWVGACRYSASRDAGVPWTVRGPDVSNAWTAKSYYSMEFDPWIPRSCFTLLPVSWSDPCDRVTSLHLRRDLRLIGNSSYTFIETVLTLWIIWTALRVFIDCELSCIHQNEEVSWSSRCWSMPRGSMNSPHQGPSDRIWTCAGGSLMSPSHALTIYERCCLDSMCLKSLPLQKPDGFCSQFWTYFSKTTVSQAAPIS